MTDLLWADPFGNEKEARIKDYSKNYERNTSCFFGLDPVRALLKKESLLSIIRAH
jgi:hypothetical protein